MSFASNLQKKEDVDFDPAAMDCKASARYLGISYCTLRNLAHDGKIPCLMFPAPYGNGRSMRKLLFLKSDLDRFLALHRIEARR
ncbi:helix-turn-helix domain-containing protein [bacterium]|nr:helix-turn-helix domain-containing protein [bacterium]MCI0611375.1 helix-turn-helix domain-containing protein [bacterium]